MDSIMTSYDHHADCHRIIADSSYHCNAGESLLYDNFLIDEDDFSFLDGLLDNCFDDVSSVSTTVSFNKSNTNYYNDDAKNDDDDDDDGINNNPSSLLISGIEAFSAENILTFDNYCEQLYFNADDMNFLLDASPQPVLTKFIWTPELDNQLHSLVISCTHGRYHNWQLIANELGHKLNNKQCCQRWKCIKHRYIVNKKKRSISDISGNDNTSDNEEDSHYGHQFPSPLHSVVVLQAVDKNNHLFNHETHQPVTAEEVPVMIGQKQSRKYDVNVEKAFYNQKRKKEPHEIRTKWAPEMDVKLREGVEQHGKNWKLIAELLNNVVDSKNCQRRWSTVVKPKLDGCNDDGPWTLDEFYKLKELVKANTNDPTQTHVRGKLKNKVTINWTTISKEMNRQFQSCVNNWKQIQNQSLKQGPFTENEDEIIINKLLEALTEYGKLPRGIWVKISHGLNRDLNSVYEHWRQILCKKKCFDFSYEDSIC